MDFNEKKRRKNERKSRKNKERNKHQKAHEQKLKAAMEEALKSGGEGETIDLTPVQLQWLKDDVPNGFELIPESVRLVNGKTVTGMTKKARGNLLEGVGQMAWPLEDIKDDWDRPHESIHALN